MPLLLLCIFTFRVYDKMRLLMLYILYKGGQQLVAHLTYSHVAMYTSYIFTCSNVHILHIHM